MQNQTTTTTTAQPMTQQEQYRSGWERRALELARQHDLIGSAFYRGESALCETVEMFSVRSVSAGSIYIGRHTVEHDLVRDTLHCDCKAGQHGRPCGHSGSVLDYLTRRAALLAIPVCDAAEELAQQQQSAAQQTESNRRIDAVVAEMRSASRARVREEW